MDDGLRYAAAQVSSYLVATTGRITDMETLQSDADLKIIECEELRTQLEKIETDKRCWEDEREMVLLEKENLADQVPKLEEEGRHLDDRVGDLSLDNAGLTEPTAELDVDLVTESTVKGALEKYVSWILNDGLSRVVDRVGESP